MNINKKDIIGINQEIGEGGNLRNESSLAFALSLGKDKKSWLYEVSYLLRSLLVDHAFEDGNKRTALALSILYVEDQGLLWDKERLVKTMHQIAKKNVKSIEQIGRMIKNVLY